MSFLERIRRVFIVFSLLMVASYAFIGWESQRPPIWCHEAFAPGSELIVEGADSSEDYAACPTDMENFLKQAGGALLYSGAGSAFLFVVWLCMRWGILCAIPTAGQRKELN